MKQMSLSYGILGFLNYAPMSGYDLAKAFASSVKFFWHAQNSHIYLELKNLEKRGYISSETVVQSDRPNKKIFSITEAGKTAFMSWLATGAGDDDVQFKSEFLMKVFFSGNLPPPQSIDILGRFKADCEAYLEKMGSTPESIERYGSKKESYQTLYWQFTVDFGYNFIKCCIDWAGRCIETLEEINRQYLKGE